MRSSRISGQKIYILINNSWGDIISSRIIVQVIKKKIVAEKADK